MTEPGGGGGGGKATTTTTLGFSHEPDDVVVARGQSARLDCLVRLPPPVDRNISSSTSTTSTTSTTTTTTTTTAANQSSPKHLEEPIAFDILWFQDGQPVLLPDQRRHLLANGSLYFDKVKTHSSSMSSGGEETLVSLCVRDDVSGRDRESG